MKRIIIILFLSCVFFPAVTSAEVKMETFPYYKSLKAPAHSREKIASFNFDNEMYKHTNHNFSNIRIVDKDNNEVPFLLRVKTKTKTVMAEQFIDSQILNFRELEGNRIEIMIRKKRRILLKKRIRQI